jgi:octaprenyl-diphosphate synthase
VTHSNHNAALAQYGLHLGIAFQLIDDVLDYIALSPKFGKNIGDDLAEGKMTLPLIHAMNACKNSEQRNLVINAIETGSLKDLDKIQDLIFATNAVEYTVNFAHQEVAKARAAISNLPHSEFKNSLLGLSEFVVTRNY